MNFLTPQELAKRWGMSGGTLANWRLKGIGPLYEKKGWSVLYYLPTIRDYEKRFPLLLKASRAARSIK